MTKQRHRDHAFKFERATTSRHELTDEEIELLRGKPNRLERWIGGVLGIVKKREREEERVIIRHPGEDLQGADFSNRNLIEADFTAANLRYAVFTGARLTRAACPDADLREANLAKAELTNADLRGADLSGANLIGTDFAGANLQGANFTGAYIWGADFNDADLRDAVFHGAYAGGALFSHARNLTLEQFRSTIHDETGAYRLSMLPDPPPSKGR